MIVTGTLVGLIFAYIGMFLGAALVASLVVSVFGLIWIIVCGRMAESGETGEGDDA